MVVVLMLGACNGREAPTKQAPAAAAPTAPAAPVVPVEGKPVVPSSVARGAIASYGIILPAGADAATFETLARDKAKPHGIDVVVKSRNELLGDDDLDLFSRALSPADIDEVKKAASIITLRSTGKPPLEGARVTATVAHEVALASKGWVIDPDTYAIHTGAAFAEHVPTNAPDVRRLIAVHAISGDNETPFLDTAGMRRYGFPELYVAEASPAQVTPVMHLINGAAQVLLTGAGVDANGRIVVDLKQLGWDLDIIEKGTGKAVWNTRWAREADSDASADLVIQLIPPGGPSTQALDALIDECFGYRDRVTSIADDDSEILAAGRRARADLVALRPRFAKGIAVGEALTVKAKFVGDDGAVEWMWVAVVSFRGNKVEGMLANTPQVIPTLQSGQKVRVELADIADYVHEQEGKPDAGGYSIEVLRKRGLHD